MSGARFLLTFTLLISLGLFGIWLGFQARDAILGPLLMAGAVVGLLLAFRRDLGEEESEKQAEWERTKAKGRHRYVLSQVGFGALYWALLNLALLLVELYRGAGAWGASLRHLKWQAALGVLAAAICGLWALAWWSYQERKYRGVR